MKKSVLLFFALLLGYAGCAVNPSGGSGDGDPSVSRATTSDPRVPMKLTLYKIYTGKNYDTGLLGDVNDVHVQYLFTSASGGGKGQDGIDYGEWQIAGAASASPSKVMKVYVPASDSLRVCAYDDDSGSIGRGSHDTTGADDVIVNASLSSLSTRSGTYSFNGGNGDGSYVQVKAANDSANQSGYASYPWVMYSPFVVQPDVDRNGNNKVIAVIYTAPVNNTITFYIVYQDEDHPLIDSTYDVERLQQWKRLEDVEPVVVHYTSSGIDWIQIKYGGGQSYSVTSPNDNDVRKFYTSSGQIQFSGTHPKIYTATWNHLHDVKARTDLTWSWAGTYNLLLIDGTGMNSDYLTIAN